MTTITERLREIAADCRGDEAADLLVIATEMEAAKQGKDSPIARVTVGEAGLITGQHLYAPGLPPGEHDLWSVPVRPEEPDDGGLAVRAVEELHQLGYVVRDGLLYPPERAHPAVDATLPCGHHRSLMLKSAETGADLYCELCDAQSGRRDAEQLEAELQADLVEERNRISAMRVEWAAEVVALQAEGAKSERRSIEFDDALHRHILAMRAAVVAWHRGEASDGMGWIANTLAGPGHYPSEANIALGAQALFDKEVAEHEAFRAAHPGPAPSTSKPAAGGAQALREAVQLPDMLAASEHAEPPGEEP